MVYYQDAKVIQEEEQLVDFQLDLYQKLLEEISRLKGMLSYNLEKVPGIDKNKIFSKFSGSSINNNGPEFSGSINNNGDQGAFDFFNQSKTLKVKLVSSHTNKLCQRL
jgi:hypothetical protein